MSNIGKEFREFVLRGNVVDMAVGIIVGVAFNNWVQSLVNEIVMPPIGMLVGRVDFSKLYFNLGPADYETLAAAEQAGAPIIKYGQFINQTINLLILAFVVFLLVKGVNRMRRKEDEEEADGEGADD